MNALAKSNTAPNLAKSDPASGLTIQQIAQSCAASGFFQDTREAGQALVKIQAGHELGIGPIASMRDIYIVKGKVSLSAALMASLVKKSGKYDYRIVKHTEKECSIDFYQGDEKIGNSEFTMPMATTAGLAGGDNWRKYPKNMLFSRAMSNGVRWFCSDVTNGSVYTPEELDDAPAPARAPTSKLAALRDEIAKPADAAPSPNEPEGARTDALLLLIDEAGRKRGWGPDEVDALTTGLAEKLGTERTAIPADKLNELLTKLEAGGFDDWRNKRRTKLAT